MKRINFLVWATLAVAVMLGVFGNRMLSAQDKDNLKGGKVLQRIELKGAPGWEAILVQEGSVTVEVQGKPAQTLKAGEAFTTSAGEVHNVKNASTTAPAKALAFYVAKKGTKLEELSTPAK